MSYPQCSGKSRNKILQRTSCLAANKSVEWELKTFLPREMGAAWDSTLTLTVSVLKRVKKEMGRRTPARVSPQEACLWRSCHWSLMNYPPTLPQETPHVSSRPFEERLWAVRGERAKKFNWQPASPYLSLHRSWSSLELNETEGKKKKAGVGESLSCRSGGGWGGRFCGEVLRKTQCDFASRYPKATTSDSSPQ